MEQLKWLIEYKDYVPHLSKNWRYILLPITIVWFLAQFVIFSFFGFTLGYVAALMGVFISLFEMPEDRDWDIVIRLFVLPIIAPFIWWYKYFKYGEYGVLLSKD